MIRLAALGRFWPLIPILLLAVWGWRVDQLRAVHLLDLTKERGDRRAEVAEAKRDAASAEAANADRIATAAERYAAAMADRLPIILHSKDTVISGSAPDSNRGYKPHGVLIPFNGSTPSVLLIGDSITQQNDLRFDARQLVGGIVKALGDPSGPGSFGVANFGHHGAAMEDLMDVTPGSNRFSLRYAMLAAARDMNGGRWPFTHIWSQGLRNDFSGMVSAATPEDALVLLKARAQAWWDFLAKTFPGIPIIQSTISARVTNDSATNYTLVDGQQPRPATAGIALEAFNTWLVQTTPAPLAMAVDLQDGQRELRSDPNFTGQSPVWARLAFVKAGGGKLATALAAGTAVSTIKITASMAPAVGSACYFEPGTSSVEMRGNIATVTDNGDGTFTLGLAASISPSVSHAVGSVFMTAPTTDGTHPESVVHELWAAMIRPLKPLIASL